MMSLILFFLKVTQAILSLLWYYINFRIVFFYFYLVFLFVVVVVFSEWEFERTSADSVTLGLMNILVTLSFPSTKPRYVSIYLLSFFFSSMFYSFLCASL